MATCPYMKKAIFDRNNKEITKGSVVRYQDGWQKVTAVANAKLGLLNLGGTFSGRVNHQRVPVTDVYEDEAAWWKNYQQSETYMCQ